MTAGVELLTEDPRTVTLSRLVAGALPDDDEFTEIVHGDRGIGLGAQESRGVDSFREEERVARCIELPDVDIHIQNGSVIGYREPAVAIHIHRRPAGAGL